MRKYLLAVLVVVIFVVAVLAFTGQKSVENEMPVIFTTGEMLTSPTGFYVKEINSGRRCEELADATDFIVFGDTQPRNEEDWAISEQIVGSIAATEHEFIVHVGDHVEHGNGDTEWDRYFELIEPIYGKDKYFAVIGNHDAPLTLWRENWDLPGNERWYSFDRGDTHFIVLDVIQSLYDGRSVEPEQKSWLMEDLPKCRESSFCFVFMHVPPVSWKGGTIRTEDNKFMPLFESHGVDAIFAGHVHAYERGNIGDVGYITSGGGGGKFHLPTGEGNNGKLLEEFPYEDKTITKTSHFAKVSTTGERTVGCVYDIDGKTLDSFEILKR